MVDSIQVPHEAPRTQAQQCRTRACEKMAIAKSVSSLMIQATTTRRMNTRSRPRCASYDRPRQWTDDRQCRLSEKALHLDYFTVTESAPRQRGHQRFRA